MVIRKSDVMGMGGEDRVQKVRVNFNRFDVGVDVRYNLARANGRGKVQAKLAANRAGIKIGHVYSVVKVWDGEFSQLLYLEGKGEESAFDSELFERVMGTVAKCIGCGTRTELLGVGVGVQWICDDCSEGKSKEELLEMLEGAMEDDIPGSGS